MIPLDVSRKLLFLLPLVALTSGVAVAQPKIDPAQPVPVPADVLKQIETKRAELAAAVDALPKRWFGGYEDVVVYLKAVEWQVRHNEFYGKEPWKQTLTVLDAGLKRVKAAETAPWRQVRGRPVVFGYRSEIDSSVQPFAVTLPENFDPRKPWRLDVVLHGRDATLTETKFIAQREAAKPGKAPDRVVLEVYGRGNNAYRWVGERDVFEAILACSGLCEQIGNGGGQLPFIVVRGFSMGGAGTWHIGLHHSPYFNAIGPGAGFTTTHGYIKNLPDKLPNHVERCLRIYDAVGYAENVFNVPTVAYSGANDPQKAAADNIEAALKGFKEPVKFTHLVAPGLEHKQPPEWFERQDAEIRKHLVKPIHSWQRVRFVTYTTRYDNFGLGRIGGLDRHYDKAVIDARVVDDRAEVRTENVRRFRLDSAPTKGAVVDGQHLPLPAGDAAKDSEFVKAGGRWTWGATVREPKPQKWSGLQGPIDDAFMDPFVVVPPGKDDRSPAVERYRQFEQVWDRYFRGRLPVVSADKALEAKCSLALFGTPATNPLLAKVVEKLPITWTSDRLVVNGVSYDPTTHFPVLIYPNPLKTRYVVINSGHTFSAADLKGTNANLYPRLGDWAVLKVSPTAEQPHATEVVAAGLFDEYWQFPKK